jgi:hypothetical protein
MPGILVRPDGTGWATVEVVRRLEWQKGPDAHHEGPEDLVADVEVVVRIAGPLPGHDAVVGVRGGIPREADAELGALFEALEDEVNAEALLALHPLPVRSDIVLLFQLLRLQRLGVRPLDRNAVVAGEGLDPLLVVLRALGQRLLGEGVEAVHIPEEMHDVLGARQEGQVTLNDDAVETVIYKQEQAAKQLGEGLHRPPPRILASATRSSAKRPVEAKCSCCAGDSNSHGTFGSPPVSITKGSALEIPSTASAPADPCPRDFKGGALGYS